MSNQDLNMIVIGAFAKACERLNEYAQELRRRGTFATVTTRADIRYLASGWKLEKFVEAELSAKDGLWAAWWIDLGGTDQLWQVSASLSISHTDIYFEIEDAEVGSPQDLVCYLIQRSIACWKRWTNTKISEMQWRSLLKKVTNRSCPACHYVSMSQSWR